MKFSELIKELKSIMSEYGDLEIEVPVYNDIEYNVANTVRVQTYYLPKDINYTTLIIE